MDSSKIANVSITPHGTPEFWIGHHGLDGYSVPLTSFLMTTRSLGDLVAEGGASKDTESNLIAMVERAVTETSLSLSDEISEPMVRDVANVYRRYRAAIREHMEENAIKPRVVNRVFEVEATEEAAATDRPASLGDDGRLRKFKVKGIVHDQAVARFKISDGFLEEHLRSPMVAAVTPYVADTMDPTLAAAEIGLNLELARSPRQVVREAAFIAVIAAFENFLNGMITQLIREHPQVLRSSKETFTALQILDAPSSRALRDQIREKIVKEKTQTFKTRSDFLVSVLGDEAALDKLERFIAARNDLVHHGGRVSQTHVDRHHETKYEVGDSIDVSEPYFRDALTRLKQHATTLVRHARAEARSAAE